MAREKSIGTTCVSHATQRTRRAPVEISGCRKPRGMKTSQPCRRVFGFGSPFISAFSSRIAIDLITFKQRGRELSMRAAARRSVLWVLVSLGFNALVWRLKGPHHGLDFFTGYLIEYSLSVDNIFVFVLIFAHFRVPAARPTSRLGLGNSRCADHARNDDLMRHRAGAAVSFRSLSLWLLSPLHGVADVVWKTSPARFCRGLGDADVPPHISDYTRIL